MLNNSLFVCFFLNKNFKRYSQLFAKGGSTFDPKFFKIQ
jgi:hypothetical protein